MPKTSIMFNIQLTMPDIQFATFTEMIIPACGRQGKLKIEH